MYDDKMCLLGGRGWLPVECLALTTNTWSRTTTYTDDIHHTQPVVWNGEVWIVAGWQGPWGNEVNLDNVIVYNPSTDSLRTQEAIPDAFARGGAGVAVYNDLMYVVQGAVDGHQKALGASAFWGLSTYNPATGSWAALSATPGYARDHFMVIARILVMMASCSAALLARFATSSMLACVKPLQPFV